MDTAGRWAVEMRCRVLPRVGNQSNWDRGLDLISAADGELFIEGGVTSLTLEYQGERANLQNGIDGRRRVAKALARRVARGGDRPQARRARAEGDTKGNGINGEEPRAAGIGRGARGTVRLGVRPTSIRMHPTFTAPTRRGLPQEADAERRGRHSHAERGNEVPALAKNRGMWESREGRSGSVCGLR